MNYSHLHSVFPNDSDAYADLPELRDDSSVDENPPHSLQPTSYVRKRGEHHASCGAKIIGHQQHQPNSSFLRPVSSLGTSTTNGRGACSKWLRELYPYEFRALYTLQIDQDSTLELEEIRAVFQALLNNGINITWFRNQVFTPHIAESLALVLRNQRDRLLLDYYKA